MLRTNSEQARENIREYIMEHFDGRDYTEELALEWPDIARFILEVFRQEKPADWFKHLTEQQRFEDWAQGLPSVLDTLYYYNRSAVDDLGDILEETPEEKAKYSESLAAERLTNLIYRELLKGAEQ